MPPLSLATEHGGSDPPPLLGSSLDHIPPGPGNQHHTWGNPTSRPGFAGSPPYPSHNNLARETVATGLSDPRNFSGLAQLEGAPKHGRSL
jgi:hypothetical protein